MWSYSSSWSWFTIRWEMVLWVCFSPTSKTISWLGMLSAYIFSSSFWRPARSTWIMSWVWLSRSWTNPLKFSMRSRMKSFWSLPTVSSHYELIILILFANCRFAASSLFSFWIFIRSSISLLRLCMFLFSERRLWRFLFSYYKLAICAAFALLSFSRLAFWDTFSLRWA